MRNVRRLTVLVAVVAGLAMLASCTGNGSDGTRAGGRSGQVFVFGTAAEPVVLDGAQVRSIEAARVVSQLFETLVERKLDGTGFEPGLARSWEASADGRTWTFRLQRGVRFHDGTPFDARAVCANFERWYHFRGIQQTMAVALSWRDVFGGFATQDDPSAPKTSLYRSCEARTDDEVVINLNEPSGRFLSAVAAWPFSIASPDALRRYEADKVTGTPSGPRFEGTFGTEHPIGTGPFKLERWARNDRMVLVRNDDYWGDKPRTERLIFRAIPDAAARRQALQAGELHGYEPVDPADLDALRRSGFRVFERLAVNVGFITFNQTKPPLDNLKVRQAVAHALNREAVIRAKYPPGTAAAKEFTPPSVFGHAEDVTTYPYDPDRARTLLRESGVARPTLEFWYPAGQRNPDLPDPEGTFQAFRADLEQVGFVVVPRPVPVAGYFPAVISGSAPIAFLSLYGDADPDAFLGTMFEEPAAPWGFFNDPELFRLVKEGRREVDQAKRTALYQQANRMLMDILPGLPLVHVKPAVVVRSEVQGFRPHALGPVEELSTVTVG